MARYIGATLDLKEGNFFANMKSAVSATGNLKTALGGTTTAMTRHGKQATATGTALKDLAKRAVGVVAAYASFSAVKNFMSDCVALANEQAAAEQRLQTTMSNVAGTTQAQINGIKAYASELQGLTTVGDEVAITGASQLATFQLHSDTIKTLMPALEDLAVSQYGVAVSSSQMQSMANLVGKVMTGNVSSLTRYGVTMSDAQKKILQTGTESEKAAMLVKVLGQNFGGLAEAMANTPEGRIQQLKNAWGDMKEVVGAQLYPVITTVLTYITNKLPAISGAFDGVIRVIQGIYDRCEPAFSSLFSALERLGGTIADAFSGGASDAISNLASTVLPILANALTAVTNAVSGVIQHWNIFGPLLSGVLGGVLAFKGASGVVDIFGKMSGNVGLLGKAFKGLSAGGGLTGLMKNFGKIGSVLKGGTGAVGALGKAFTFLSSPVGIAIAAIGAVIAIIILLRKNSEKLRTFFVGLWDKISSAVTTAWDAIKQALTPLVDAIKGAFQSAWDGIKVVWGYVQQYFQAQMTTLKAIFSVVKEYIGGAFKTAFAVVKAVWDTAVSFFTTIRDTIKGVFFAVRAAFSGDFQGAWDMIKAVFATWGEFFSGLWDSVKNVFATAGEWFTSVFTTAWTAVQTVFATWTEFFSGLWNGIVGVFGNIGTWFTEQFTQAVENIKAVFSTLGGFFSGIWGTIQSTFSALGTKIGDAIGNAVRAGINGVLTAIENVINKGIGLINGAIDLINKVVPGNPIGHINTLKFPRLATGGIVAQPTFAQIGEAGTEAVLPLDSFWNRLETIMTGREYSYAGGGNTVTNNVYVTVDGGSASDETLGDRIARRIVDALENM